MKILKPFKIIKDNPMILKKVWFYLKRGEIKYLLSKGKNKLKSNQEIDENIVKIEPKDYFTKFKIEDYRVDISIDIIIPVYNGYEFLNPLFDSLERNTLTPHRLIIIDDCSPDERVKPLLEKRLKKHKNSIFLEHKENLGFVKSVNEGYSYTSNHFIILNTDTEVPPFWLERVIYPIINMDNIASTTPFTNSGEIASFPNFIADNNIFEEMSVDELDKSFRDVNAKNFYAKAPTGVGFCMGVNYNLIQDIGFFIEKDFGKGYGEENDWCQRAIKQGYSNLIIPNLFVYHKHGGSFTAEQKKKLIQENSLKLLKRYPNYDKDVQDYISLDPHKTLRQLIVIISTSKSKGVYLMINQLLGGGSNIYFENRVDEYKKLNRAVLELIYNYYSNSFYLYFSYKDYNFKFELDIIKDIEEIFKNITCKEIFVNNLVSFKDISLVIDFIESISKRDRAKLIIPIHDYFMICPNYTLLNQKNIYCNIPNIDECEKCLNSSNLEWKTFINENIDIRQWRDNFKRLIDISSQIIAFSTSSKDIFLKAYKDIDSSKIKIIPHKVEPLEKVTKKSNSNSYTTIGILGAINEAKGASILEELLKKIDKQNLPIKIVLIGDTSKALSSKNLKITGKYIRDDLPKITEQEEIDIFLIPSICPETFSYTTQEIIMMDMPLMVFNVGAPANRAKKYKKGVVLEPNYVDSVIEYITNNE